MTLVTLPTAKMHLHITDTLHDADVQLKLDQATASIVHYLKGQADPAWTEATAPLPVQAAVLRLLTYLYEDRGDHRSDSEATPGAATWEEIFLLLVGYRDPALA